MIRSKREFLHYFNNELFPAYQEEIKQAVDIRNRAIKASASFIVFVPVCFLLYSLIGFFGVILAFIGLIFFIIYKGKKEPALPQFESNEKKLTVLKNNIFTDIVPKVLPGFTFQPEYSITEDQFRSYRFIQLYNYFHSEDAFIGDIGGNQLRIGEFAIYRENGNNNNRKYSVYKGLITEFELNIPKDFKMLLQSKGLHFTPTSDFLSVRAAKRNENEYHYDIEEDSPNPPIQKDEQFEKWQEHYEELDESVELDTVTLGNISFDKQFTVQTNDNIRTFKILQPSTLEKIMIGANKLDKDISISISNGRIAILSNNEENLFEIIGEQVNGEKVWDELNIIVDTLAYIQDLGISFKTLNRL